MVYTPGFLACDLVSVEAISDGLSDVASYAWPFVSRIDRLSAADMDDYEFGEQETTWASWYWSEEEAQGKALESLAKSAPDKDWCACSVANVSRRVYSEILGGEWNYAACVRAVRFSNRADWRAFVAENAPSSEGPLKWVV